MIEQVLMDTAGMQPRFLYNDLPWLAQPAIYAEAVMTINNAKTVAEDWIKDTKKKKES